MKRHGFYFDMGHCIGCKACQIACKDRHDLWEGQFFRRVFTIAGPSRLHNYSGACNHCAKPACLAVCPAGAISVREDGTVVLDRKRCVGCGNCEKGCPYHAVSMAPGTKGRAAKCDACAELRSRGQNPACVDACPGHCLQFGDLDALEKIHAPGLVRELSILPPSCLTEPSLLIRTGLAGVNGG